MPSFLEFRALCGYFRSGWAFLIPYLAVYLLYAWRQWPVNTVATGGGVPCLLHVYWMLHGIHLVLGGLAARAWWLGLKNTSNARQSSPPHVDHAGFDRIWPVLPWLCLALIFWIPGIYLEWPSDPWEHLRRINEWHALDQVTAHSAWKKSSYFLPYSLTGHTTGVSQLNGLNYYYTGTCLLLSWQYYRIARAIGLSERASFVFVLLNAITFGNNVFSFYRYYGLSSSIFAQIGTVALTRIALESLQKKPASWPLTGSGLLPAAAATLALLAWIAFNHVQGLLITGVCVASVFAWWLIEARRALMIWLVLAVAGLSFVVTAGFPELLQGYEAYRTQQWLSPWFGFNLFQYTSPAFGRAVAILGLPGLLGLLAGLLLLRRNSVVGWLTLVPYLALCTPVFAVPFLHQLVTSGQPVSVFHRTLFGIPAGLALVAIYANRKREGLPSDRMAQRSVSVAAPPNTPRLKALGLSTYHVLILGIAFMVLIPASEPGFNRLYNALSSSPDDLDMDHVLGATEGLDTKLPQFNARIPFIASTGISFVAHCSGLEGTLLPTTRSTFALPRDKTVQSENFLVSYADNKAPVVFLLQSASKLYTPYSHMGYLSQHWYPLEVAFEHSSGPEAEQIARRLEYQKFVVNRSIYYLHLPKN